MHLYVLPSYSVYPVRGCFTPGIRINKGRSATRVIFRTAFESDIRLRRVIFALSASDISPCGELRISTSLPLGIPRAACRRALNDEVKVELRILI